MIVSQNIKFVVDNVLSSQVLSLESQDLPNTFISCPSSPSLLLGIKLPILVLLVRNISKPFSFEVETLDEYDVVHRFRSSTYQKKTRIDNDIATMPLRMEDGWNQIVIDLNDLSRQCYGSKLKQTNRIIIHPNIFIRRVYFSSEIPIESQIPADLRLYCPE
ncbi:hypothetical protein BB560_001378 [Smittium megazygosporum]|uniref:CFA20 domain-containing protein n=1 Tax=Smittium megazygosporum TaxID=133381 RepID=A0A2T9ZHQ3_9FUNG|nr:hypothetical protein BB560_001378 [Smittium megazygosporum]